MIYLDAADLGICEQKLGLTLSFFPSLPSTELISTHKALNKYLLNHLENWKTGVPASKESFNLGHCVNSLCAQEEPPLPNVHRRYHLH